MYMKRAPAACCHPPTHPRTWAPGTHEQAVGASRLGAAQTSRRTDLAPADRDLAIRLLTRPADAPWWTLQLCGSHLINGDGSGTEMHEPQGELHPILVDTLGDPVVAAWTSPTDDQRWYIVPDGTDWNNIFGWLTQRALPEIVPGALRRVRSTHFVDPDLQTADEASARAALDELEVGYKTQRAALERELREAKERAEPVRYGLLYGSGGDLVKAVAQALKAAGCVAADLDEELGATKSADLLVSDAGTRRSSSRSRQSAALLRSHLNWLVR